MKTLYIVSKGINQLSEEEVKYREQQNLHPRDTFLEDALSADVLDERYLANQVPSYRQWIYRYLPTILAQVLEALWCMDSYDIIFAHSERVGLPLALLMRLIGSRKPLVMVISRITSRDEGKEKQKKWFMKRAYPAVSKFLIWSSVQYKIAVEELGIPEEKVQWVKRGTDQQFWKPMAAETNTICSVGMEMRDYPTLVEALRPLDIPCHFAVGKSRGEIFQTVRELYEVDEIPANITTGPKSYQELRELYARSRFVVISLLPTDSDNGNTAILEAMAMGKAVICSRVEGQVDVIKEGETGVFVPQGDPIALREAITDLWDNPEKAKRMGQVAREQVEKHHNLEDFVGEIQSVVTEAAGYKGKTRKVTISNNISTPSH